MGIKVPTKLPFKVTSKQVRIINTLRNQSEGVKFYWNPGVTQVQVFRKRKYRNNKAVLTMSIMEYSSLIFLKSFGPGEIDRKLKEY